MPASLSIPAAPPPDVAVPAGEEFLWGVATSGYQSEGGFNGPGDPCNNWAWSERAGDIPVTGRTADFWNRAEGDFALASSLGLNAFRLSIEWSRVQPGIVLGARLPEKITAPPFDDAALHGYARRLAQCRAAGLEPVVTLHHFVHPAWLGSDPWLEVETITYYLKYVRHVMEYLLRVMPAEFGCAPPRFWITINEPNLLAFNHYVYRLFPSAEAIGLGRMLTCLAILLEAHARATLLVHELYAKHGAAPPMMTFNNYASDLFWCDQAWVNLFFLKSQGIAREEVVETLFDRARVFDDEFVAANLLPGPGTGSRLRFVFGQSIKLIQHAIARAVVRSHIFDRLLDLLYQAERPLLDLISFDYYDPFAAHAFRMPDWGDYEDRRRSWHEWGLEAVASKWWDWRILPAGMAFFVEQASRFGLPVLIAENGMAQRRLADNTPIPRRDRFARSDYVREHVRMTARLREQGYPLLGYLHWSFCDNYEWGSFAPRFGLYALDYTGNLERRSIDPTGDNPSETYAAEIRAARERLRSSNQQP